MKDQKNRNTVKQSSYWETKSRLVGKQIPRILRNSKLVSLTDRTHHWTFYPESQKSSPHLYTLLLQGRFQSQTELILHIFHAINKFYYWQFAIHISFSTYIWDYSNRFELFLVAIFRVALIYTYKGYLTTYMSFVYQRSVLTKEG